MCIPASGNPDNRNTCNTISSPTLPICAWKELARRLPPSPSPSTSDGGKFATRKNTVVGANLRVVYVWEAGGDDYGAGIKGRGIGRAGLGERGGVNEGGG